MKKEQIVKEVNSACKACLACDPSCTGNIIKKILNNSPSVKQQAMK